MGDPWRPEIPPEVRARLEAIENDPNDSYQRGMTEQMAKTGPGVFDQVLEMIKRGLQVLTQEKPEKENYDIPSHRVKTIDEGTKRYTGTASDPIYNKNEKEYTQRSKGKGLNQR